MGNCGFGIAPTRPAHRDLILRTLESVEGMSLDALRAGVGATGRSRASPSSSTRSSARHGDQRRRARRPHAGPPLRDGRGGDRARGDAPTRSRTMRALVARRARAPARSASRPRSRRRTSATPGGRCRAAPRRWRRSRRSPTASREARPRRHAGDDRPRLLPRRARRDPRSAPARPVTWTALLGGMLGPDGHRCVLERVGEAAGRGRRGDAAGVVPAAHGRVPDEGALPAREHVAASSRSRSADRAGKRAHLRRSRVPRAVPRAQRERRARRALGRHGQIASRRRSPRSTSAASATSRPSAACIRST